MNSDIGNRIKQIRLSKKLDIKWLADQVSMHSNSMSKIEREGTNSLETLYRIAEALGVKVTEFFQDEPSEVRDRNPAYGLASKEDIQLLISYMQRQEAYAQKQEAELSKLREEIKKLAGRKTMSSKR